MKNFFKAYLKHFALNVGQALQGIRYIYSHPDFDQKYKRGSFKHFFHSLFLRTKRVLNDIFFALFPPHWHHSKLEIESFHLANIHRWFQYGYCAWRFDESGNFKKISEYEDKRWDPRCH